MLNAECRSGAEISTIALSYVLCAILERREGASHSDRRAVLIMGLPFAEDEDSPSQNPQFSAPTLARIVIEGVHCPRGDTFHTPPT